VLNGQTISNVIIANTKEDAELATNSTCIEYPKDNGIGIGWTYDSNLEQFIGPQPFPSWKLDENFVWQPPIKLPTDKKDYFWDEPTVSWIEVTND